MRVETLEKDARDEDGVLSTKDACAIALALADAPLEQIAKNQPLSHENQPRLRLGTQSKLP